MARWIRSVLIASTLIIVTWTSMGQAVAYDLETPSIVTKTPTIGRRGLYIVQPDDTLWDLCEVFFGEPWFWPSLWSYNPQITNPHWLFPGDLIQIRRPQPPGNTTLIWSDSRYTTEKPNLEILSRYVGYLPDRPFRRSGEIVHARESHVTLGEYDEIYIQFGVDTEVRKGQRFTIYRYEGQLQHPKDGDLIIGHKIRHLGIAKVLSADSQFVKALILKSYEEIHRGDLITSIFPHAWVVGPVENESEVIAQIVDYQSPTTFAGQWQYVYIDKGRNDGIVRGNRFVIERRGDGLWELDGNTDDIPVTKFPWETYGEVMVVESFEETSLGIVSRAIRELVRGDRLRMEPGY